MLLKKRVVPRLKEIDSFCLSAFPSRTALLLLGGCFISSFVTFSYFPSSQVLIQRFNALFAICLFPFFQVGDGSSRRTLPKELGSPKSPRSIDNTKQNVDTLSRIVIQLIIALLLPNCLPIEQSLGQASTPAVR